MNELARSDSKVTTAHRAKGAYIYVRQSSLAQVIKHSASTDLQYQLVARAVALGWPRERVVVIDEDLGKSGASSVQREGFQFLMAEIGLGRAGIVISWDASRLARNNSDWYQLLELCSLRSALIADGERVYDPCEYHDRLLLGLSGMMSEAELHHLRQRLIAGQRHRAEQGTLRIPLPVGLVRTRDGTVQFDPDEEIQARIRLVLTKFQELGKALGVLRYLRDEQLLMPARPLRGPAPHEVVWQPARYSRVLAILTNPAYAGAYVYGRTSAEAARRNGRGAKGQVASVPMAEWAVVIQGAHPGYIDWEEFVANQKRLSTNQYRPREGQAGAPREGQALLQGIVRCHVCGSYMQVRYSGPGGRYAVYECAARKREYGGPHCQEVRAAAVDVHVAEEVLAALTPDRVAIALAALSAIEEEYAGLRKQWQLRLERARYEAERARRQYQTVEPENRLVARSLEQDWEAKLRAVEQAEREYEDWVRTHRLEISAGEREELLRLGEDLPRVWYAATTSAAERKEIVRLVVREVLLDQQRQRGKVWVQVTWQTGATSEVCLTRSVRQYDGHAQIEELRRRITALHRQGRDDAEIAVTLNAEGYRTARDRRFNAKVVYRLRQRWDLPSQYARGPIPDRWKDGAYSTPGAAKVIGVCRETICRWIKLGWLKASRCTEGKRSRWKIPLTQKRIAELRAYAEREKPFH